MYIVSQGKRELYNYTVFAAVYVQYESICIGYTDGHNYVIGKYRTEERAKEVFKDLLDTLFPPACIVLKNSSVTPDFDEKANELKAPVIPVETHDKLPDVRVNENAVYFMPEE